MKNTPPVMNMLNDVAWHVMQINKISDALNKAGISDTDIESYLDDFQAFIQDTYINDIIEKGIVVRV